VAAEAECGVSSRHRSCHHLVPNTHIAMPNPALLLRLAPVMGTLVDAASEFDSFDPGRWTAVQFVQWLDIAVREAAARSREGAA
jgi:hypothetical protein